MVDDWRKIVVSEDTPLRDALVVIDREALRIALVADADFRLLGTITDGDIRRALINGMDLSVRAGAVMNSRPTTAPEGTDDGELRAVLQSKSILALPIVDRDNRIIDLATLQTLAFGPKRPNPVFIMAGGFGTRLRPLTESCPKPMIKIGDKPILQLILEQLGANGFSDFYISTHYLPEIIRDYFGDGSHMGARITYVHEHEPLGTGGALSLLPDDLPDLPMIMMNGDIVTKVDFGELVDYHREKGGIATMCVRLHEYQLPYGVVEPGHGTVRQIVEKPTQQYLINAGIYVLDPSLVRAVTPGKHVDMPELIARQIDRGHQVNVFPIHEYWLDIGNKPDLQRAETEVAAAF